MKQKKQNGLVWSGLSTTWFHLWSGLDGNAVGIGTWTKRTISATCYSLCGSPRLSLCGWSLITRSVFGSGILKVHISLRSMYCICMTVNTWDKTGPMRDTSIYTHQLISLTIVK